MDKFDNLYMDIAGRLAQQSYAIRHKVGAVIVKDGSIIAEGWNGTPNGWENECEDYAYLDPGSEHPIMSTTKREVLHAESNALMKVAKSTQSSAGATLYTILAPCFECAKLIVQAGITRVVYKDVYRDEAPLEFLSKCNVKCEKIDEGTVPLGGEVPPTKDFGMYTQR